MQVKMVGNPRKRFDDQFFRKMFFVCQKLQCRVLGPTCFMFYQFFGVFVKYAFLSLPKKEILRFQKKISSL